MVRESKGIVKIDKLDQLILYELDKNSFQSFAKIGKKLKKGRDVIQYRVKRLEELGIIKNYVLIIDYGKLGHLMGALYWKYRHETPKLREEVVEYLQSKPNTWWIDDMEGNFDIGFGIYSKSIEDLREAQRELMSKYKRNISEYRSRVFNHHYIFTRDYLHPNPDLSKRRRLLIKAKNEKITDSLDDKILVLLAENARMLYTEAAEKLGVSAKAVYNRIQALKEKGVILGSRPAIDLRKLGYEWYKLDIYLSDYSIYEELIDFVAKHPNVIYAYDAIGGEDLGLDIEVKNYDEFKQLEDSILERFADSIEKTDFIIFTKERKLTYLPPID